MEVRDRVGDGVGVRVEGGGACVGCRCGVERVEAHEELTEAGRRGREGAW